MITQIASGAAEQRKYLLATANISGTYYPVGVALATLTKVKLEPDYKLSLTAVSSAGSAENLLQLGRNEVQFAILQGLYGYWAWNGIGPFAANGPQKHLRSITMLWQNVEHFAVKTDYVKTGTIADLQELRGKTLSIGDKHSGSAGSGMYILERLGFLPSKDFNLVNLTYGDSADAIQKGDIEMMNIPGGPPVAALDRAFTALGKDVTILGFTSGQTAAVNSEYPLWAPFTLAANTYPGQDKPVTTIAQPNFLAVREDVPDEDVYRILKAIYGNLPFLNNIHPITQAMKMGAAIEGLPIPLHPGAARFYRENGIKIPDELIIR
jgi:TRAP transporter TAXI family solute receptor